MRGISAIQALDFVPFIAEILPSFGRQNYEPPQKRGSYRE
jgi:hypothetical protein